MKTFEEDSSMKTTIYAAKKLSTLGNQLIHTLLKINFGYSINLGIPQNKTDLLQMIEKVEMVIKRMRRKVLCKDKRKTNAFKTE